MQYTDIITKTGLSKDQAIIYETMLKNGILPASKIAMKAGLKRGLSYKVIGELQDIGLVEKIDKKVALFAPTHPSKLKDILKKKNKEIEIAESGLSAILGAMVSDYNLFSGKPNIRFFEEEKGVKEVLADSLSSTETLLSYADIESIQKFIPDINKWYVREREKINLKKRSLLIDTEFARKFLKDYHTEITENRLIKLDSDPFHTIMHIYDNKISYITLNETEMIGVIIEDTFISNMHKNIFDFTWGKAEQLLKN